MKKLKRLTLYHIKDGVRIEGAKQGQVIQVGSAIQIYGDCSSVTGNLTSKRGDVTGLYGDISTLWGDVTGLTGDATYIYGDATGLVGNLDNCELTHFERKKSPFIGYLVSDDVE